MGDTVSTGSTRSGETKDPKFVDAKAFEDLKKQFETIKATQAGSDKKVAELLHENEELKKAKMSAEEKREYERKAAEEKLSQKERELQDREVKLMKIDILNELELPHNVIGRIHGATRDEIYADAKAYKAELDALSKAEVTKRLGGSGAPPSGGSQDGAVTYDSVMAMPDKGAQWIRSHRTEWEILKNKKLKGN